MHVSEDDMAEKNGGGGNCMKEGDQHHKRTLDTLISCRRKRGRVDCDQMHEEVHLREKEAILEDGMHPYGIEPWGNYYGTAEYVKGASIRDASLGNLAALDDQSLLEILGLLNLEELLLVCMTSRALYVFGHHDELWRTLALNTLSGDFRYADSWKSTLGRSILGAKFPGHRPLNVRGLYSDLLFQPWLCATVGVLPDWLEVSNIDRRENLTLESFIAEYEKPNKPVIITDIVKNWPAYKKWDRDYLLDTFGEKEFEVGPVKMKLRNFYHYCENAKEEKPLYLFDKDFPDTCPSLTSDYDIPQYFKQDFFAALGDSRPNWRWIIIGPARSGSSFHIDPNSTSAWNAVISGRKKWIMFPPGQRPPGVFPSADMANVATSASIWEWFLNFYPATKSCKVRPLECVCEAGEIIFVPNGWWHCVLNLEPSVAITQNYVSEQNLTQVLHFLKHKPHCVSGIPSESREGFHEKFQQALTRHHPDVLNSLAEKMPKAASVSLWDMVVGKEIVASNEEFKFAFT